MIYKITSNGSVNASYLMGTIHINDSDIIDKLGVAKDLIKHCELYLGEIDLGIVDQNEAMKALQIEDQNFLVTNYFSQRKLKKIDNVLQKYFNMDSTVLGNFYPIIAQNHVLKSKLKNDHPVDMDQELYLHAMASNKKVGGLETPHEQYSYLMKLDLGIQWQQFYDFICMPNKSIRVLNAMKQNYINNRESQLYKQVFKSLGSFRKVMLFERNKLMATRLIEDVLETTVFATVGAGHLFGNNGMISLLKKKGFKVENYHLRLEKKLFQSNTFEL